MKTYRYSSYQCTASAMEDFRKELILQKRIEFWGEGIIYWDYKRLELSVTRGYSGTNSPVGYRMNSKEGYCCPWFNLFLVNLNQSIYYFESRSFGYSGGLDRIINC